MKTPMQELIEVLKKEQELRLWSNDEFHTISECIDHAKSLLEKEKEVMVDFTYQCRNVMAADEFAINHWYDKTFNDKEK